MFVSRGITVQSRKAGCIISTTFKCTYGLWCTGTINVELMNSEDFNCFGGYHEMFVSNYTNSRARTKLNFVVTAVRKQNLKTGVKFAR